MNKVLWLRDKAGSQKTSGAGKKWNSEKSSLEKTAGTAVYIALPPGKAHPRNGGSVLKAPQGIFVVYPQKPYLRNKAVANAFQKRKGIFSAAALSFFCFIAIIFVAIGILNLMISSFRLQAYAPAYLVLEQAAHKPGSGPALQDAVVNEYQHALTREMVAADTTLVATAGNTAVSKGMLEQITIAEEIDDSVTGSGAMRKVKIYNGTAKTLDRVVVQVDVLDKAGHLLRTEHHTARRIASLGTKIISLEKDAPGAQLRCYVQEIRSKTLRTSLRTL